MSIGMIDLRPRQKTEKQERGEKVRLRIDMQIQTHRKRVLLLLF